MIYAKLDVRMWSHKKFIKAGPAATGLWSAALAFLRENESSDGRIDDIDLGRLLSLGRGPALKLAKRLVECELFAKEPGGVHVLLKYAEKNETREVIQARRDATAERVQASRARRARNGVTNGVHDHGGEGVTALIGTNGSALGSAYGSGSGEGTGGRVARHTSDDGVMGYACAAFAEGVSRATARPYQLPPASGMEARKLAEALVTFCKSRDERADWARTKGEQWARTEPARLTVHDFVDWLNGGEKPSGVRKTNGRALVQADPPTAADGSLPWVAARVIDGTGGTDG